MMSNTLLTIPFGESLSYGALAAQRDAECLPRGRSRQWPQPGLIVPCHRAIGADGTLTGFAGGLGIKARLLEGGRSLRGLSV